MAVTAPTFANGTITCKFGGTSLANADAIRRAVEIIQANPHRRYIVPSAPGKRTNDDRKVTDHLYGWFHLLQDKLNPAQAIEPLVKRFEELVRNLRVDIDIKALIDQIAEEAPRHDTADFLASRGEYLNGVILSKILDATFVEPADAVKFTYEGRIDPSTYTLLAERLRGEGLFVVPGFYGADPDGNIHTFSRGGSDVTGAIVARATACAMYENWTDVTGIRMTDPRIVPGAACIEEITYQELRELAYAGAHVLHDEAIFPIRETGIPINIRNTKQPEEKGTLIVATRTPKQPVCGIAARAGFTMINIEKTLMNLEIGFARRCLSILEEYRINFEHMPTGIDTISLIVEDEELGKLTEAVVEGIQRMCDPDRITITPGIALIATVGLGMNHHVGVAANLCNAIAKAGVNVRVLDQGSSEMNIIVGVEEEDLAKAVIAIYEAFENWR